MRTRVIKFAVAAFIGAAAALTVFLAKGLFSMTEAHRIYRVLCDGFFLAAVLLIGTGAMVFVSNEGMFSILGYAAKNFGLIFYNKKRDKERESYADYIKRKHEKRTSFGFCLITGLAYLALAFVFLALFSMNS